jgi:serine protease Do
MSYLDEVQQDIARIAEQVGPAIAGIGGRRRAVGSGVIAGDGRIVTNAHNLRGSEVHLTVGDTESDGAVAGRDVDGDIAVVSADTAGTAPAEWGSVEDITIGTPVFALSNPGGRGLRVTVGFVSGTERSFRGPRGRRIAGSIEHTAPLLPGSSGGALVDREGRLIGINTNRLGEGFYLAIPADEQLRSKVDSLARGEAPVRPRLGIGIAPPHVAKGLRRAVGLPDADGLLIRAVEEGGPADTAGLQEGDLIVAASGAPVGSVDDFYDVLEKAADGRTFELTLLRGTDERTVSVALS